MPVLRSRVRIRRCVWRAEWRLQPALVLFVFFPASRSGVSLTSWIVCVHETLAHCVVRAVWWVRCCHRFRCCFGGVVGAEFVWLFLCGVVFVVLFVCVCVCVLCAAFGYVCGFLFVLSACAYVVAELLLVFVRELGLLFFCWCGRCVVVVRGGHRHWGRVVLVVLGCSCSDVDFCFGRC